MQFLVRSTFPANKSGCGRITDLFQLINWVHQGYGCSSDHVRAFVALASLAGVTSRAVAFDKDVHIAAEFYSPERGRWEFIDPYFGAMATDTAGNFLSLLELKQMTRDSDGPPVLSPDLSGQTGCG